MGSPLVLTLGQQYVAGTFNIPTSESFNDWGGRGCHKFVLVLGGDGTKIAPTGDLFDQPPREMSSIRASLSTM